MRTPEPADVAAYLAFVEENRRQGRQEWEARQCAAGFSSSTVSATVRTVDADGRVTRRTVTDPLGLIAAYREQQDRFELGTATRHGGGRSGRKKNRKPISSRRRTVWPWAGG
jgi:hypothetical protein